MRLPELRRATDRRRCFQHKDPSLSHLKRTTTTTTSTISVCLKYCSSSFFWLKVGISSLAAAMANKTRDQPRRSLVGVPVGDVIKENKRSISKRTLELQEEVEELHKKLDREEQVQKILEMALQSRKNDETTLQFPSSLPRMTRDLLAEIVTVEAEIERIEAEICRIREENKSNQCDQAIEITTELYSPPMENPLFENKSMFFVNQAIKGHDHYDLTRSFSSVSGSAVGRLSAGTESPKNKVTRRKARDQLQYSPSPDQEKGSRRPQPNKLSEKIMKCLTCIFLRLIRTSRRVENDKSSVEQRFMTSTSSLGSRSFRDINELGPCEPNTVRQQDPYGIFKVEESLVRDVGHYKHLVICTSSSLDVKAMTSCSPLIKKLRVLLSYLSDVELRFLTHQQKLAFWINMYNTIIMHGFLENGLQSNPDDLLSLRNKAVIDIGGIKLNALAIEQIILRKKTSDSINASWKGEKDDNGDVIRRIYGLDRPEPNITFALCNGNKSSPAVRIYTSENVATELEKAKLEYLQASIVVTAKQRVMIPSLLMSKMNSFAYDLGSLLLWICNQLPISGSLRRSMVACFRGSENGDGSNVVDIIPSELDFQLLLLPI